MSRRTTTWSPSPSSVTANIKDDIISMSKSRDKILFTNTPDVTVPFYFIVMHGKDLQVGSDCSKNSISVIGAMDWKNGPRILHQ